MTNPIGTGTSVVAASPRPTGPTMTSDDFLKLLVAQVKYQDPSKPTDPAQFLTQTAQLTQVDVLNQVSASLRSTLTATVSAQAAALVGRTVDYLDADGVRRSGQVTSATFGATPTLRVGTTDVALTSVLGTRG